MNPFSLNNKTILVTGASSGIGRATAIECSKAGAKVILAARNVERLNETFAELAGDGHKVIAADLTRDESLSNLIAEIGQIDGAVLCAGTGVTLPIKFSSRKKFDAVFETNFFSTVELIRLMMKKKSINKGGSVVLMDSIGGINWFAPGSSIYGSSKAALNSFAKYAAMEYATTGVRVNCICPGMVETPLIHQSIYTDEELKRDCDRYPLKRYGRAEEIAYASIYMLSDASAWVTGTSLVIDGGASIKQ